MLKVIFTTSLLALATAGCATAEPTGTQGASAASEPAAHANLAAADGGPRGMAHLTATTAGMRAHVEATGLPPGVHGIHVHTVGRCDAPDFQTAGAHWNPAAKAHGTDNPQGSHAGDMPNITIGADGRGTLDFALSGATMDSLLDADGAAVVVHAAADDYRTDPSGNSGARIACGVLSRM